MGHKFKIGETVTVTLKGMGMPTRGHFQILLHLPQDHGSNQYRVKSVLSGQERVVMEGELS